MDRISGELSQSPDLASESTDGVIGLGEDSSGYLIRDYGKGSGIDPALFQLDELEVTYDELHAALWTMMRPKGRPSFTPPMLRDFVEWQNLIKSSFGVDRLPLRYLVLGSHAPGVFCFGGDLQLFQMLIRNGDRPGLVHYGQRCVEILHRNMNSLNLPMLTIGLVQGAALGGGFEALLSFDYLVAEESASFGLPEIMFGLFPGMGAHSLLSRKLGSAMADRLIVSNQTYSAREMYDLGLVHLVVEDGQGIAACRDFIHKSERRHPGLVNARKAMKQTRPVPLAELKATVELWADAAMQLSEADLKIMSRFTRAQERLVPAA